MEGGRESDRICVSEQARERKSERERERERVCVERVDSSKGERGREGVRKFDIERGRW